jgi:transcription elongation factor Elf1
MANKKYFNCPKCGRFVKILEGSRSGYNMDGYFWEIYYHCVKCGDGFECG